MDKRKTRYYSVETKETARRLYAEGLSCYRIARELGIETAPTVRRWMEGVPVPDWVKELPRRNQQPRAERPCARAECSVILPASSERRQKFCSKSCAAKRNNRYRRRDHKYSCLGCGKKLTHSTKGRCKVCRSSLAEKEAKGRPITGFFTNGASRAKFNQIRNWARKIMERSDRPKVCQVCGFDVYVEVCHRKSIASFPEDVPMGEVNALENLLYLCPNHHVMMDKGLLKVP